MTRQIAGVCIPHEAAEGYTFDYRGQPFWLTGVFETVGANHNTIRLFNVATECPDCGVTHLQQFNEFGVLPSARCAVHAKEFRARKKETQKDNIYDTLRGPISMTRERIFTEAHKTPFVCIEEKPYTNSRGEAVKMVLIQADCRKCGYPMRPEDISTNMLRPKVRTMCRTCGDAKKEESKAARTEKRARKFQTVVTDFVEGPFESGIISSVKQDHSFAVSEPFFKPKAYGQSIELVKLTCACKRCATPITVDAPVNGKNIHVRLYCLTCEPKRPQGRPAKKKAEVLQAEVVTPEKPTGVEAPVVAKEEPYRGLPPEEDVFKPLNYPGRPEWDDPDHFIHSYFQGIGARFANLRYAFPEFRAKVPEQPDVTGWVYGGMDKRQLMIWHDLLRGTDHICPAKVEDLRTTIKELIAML